VSKIESILTRSYRVPLPVALSDSTHGDITHFELICVLVRDDDGLEGLGYTYTVGAGGLAVHTLIDRYLKPLLLGRDPGQIEQLWQTMWWALHYGGRGGQTVLAISALDIALWDLPAREPACLCGACSAGSIPECLATLAASTCSFRCHNCLSSRTGFERLASGQSR